MRVFSWPSSYTQTTHYYKEELTKHRNAEHLEKSLVIARLSLLGGLFLFSLVFRSITSDWGSCGAVPNEASDKVQFPAMVNANDERYLNKFWGLPFVNPHLVKYGQ